MRALCLGVATVAVRGLPDRFWFVLRDRGQRVGTLDYYRFGPIRMRVDSWVEYEYRLREAEKEPQTIAWIEALFKPGDVFYDIGANVGSYSLVAHRFCGGDLRVYSFEPGFVTYPQLCHNLDLNDVGNQVVPLQVALEEHTGLANFHYQNLHVGGALHAMDQPIDDHGERFTPVSSRLTLCYRLDDFVQQFELPAPNHVKIDVDGAELKVLRGAVETLKSPEVKSLVLEMYDDKPYCASIGQLLSSYGFALYGKERDNYLYRKGSGVNA